MHTCTECGQSFKFKGDENWCPKCGADQTIDPTDHEPFQSSRKIDPLWLDYPTLRVLKSVFWIAGILTGIGGSLILFQTGAWPVFISTTISAIVLMSVPEILLILVRIERSLASIDGKLTDK